MHPPRSAGHAFPTSPSHRAGLNVGGQVPRPTPEMPSTSVPYWWWNTGHWGMAISLSLQVQGTKADATPALPTLACG